MEYSLKMNCGKLVDFLLKKEGFYISVTPKTSIKHRDPGREYVIAG